MGANAQQIAIEEVWYSFFADGLDNTIDSSLDSVDLRYDSNNVLQEPLRKTAVEEELLDWEHASPFRSFEIDMDGINTYLGK